MDKREALVRLIECKMNYNKVIYGGEFPLLGHQKEEIDKLIEEIDEEIRSLKSVK